MPVKTGPECNVTGQQVAAFRLQRHSLLQRNNPDLVTICRNVCGIQAQLMASAEIACGVRSVKAQVQDLHSALWEQRTLVKTTAMRQTLHLLPSDGFHIYKTAIQRSRMAALMRVMARINVTRRQVDVMNRTVMEALSAGPLTRNELLERVKHTMTGGLKAWVQLSWSVFRPAVVAGLICYGPDRGREGTFVRVDQWLPKQKAIHEDEAKQELFRWFLRSYGPATLRDAARWSGIPMSEAKAVWDSLEREVRAVSIDGQQGWILEDDLKPLQKSQLKAPVVRLLPHFDPYMLAHADKAHLVEMRYYKRVYRNQGWLSPVVLLNGRVAGVWDYTRRGKTLALEVELFEKLPRKTLSLIEQEAEIIARFMGLSVSGVSVTLELTAKAAKGAKVATAGQGNRNSISAWPSGST